MVIETETCRADAVEKDWHVPTEPIATSLADVANDAGIIGVVTAVRAARSKATEIALTAVAASAWR